MQLAPGVSDCSSTGASWLVAQFPAGRSAGERVVRLRVRGGWSRSSPRPWVGAGCASRSSADRGWLSAQFPAPLGGGWLCLSFVCGPWVAGRAVPRAAEGVGVHAAAKGP
ncbi:hypothetical protein GCM10010394_70290 [Streptomyces crystallinus]|uniref:Uncharacterized protein n=1 Tax=Streptomyces crystallinus TaxID=68191 RepID=A0ABP3S8F9_9ACTN